MSKRNRARDRCPRCGGASPPRSRALSRADDHTLVCERCGVAEALLAWMGRPQIPPERWPVTGVLGLD